MFVCVCYVFLFFFSERGERNTLKLNSWRARCSCFGTAQSSSMLRLYRELSSSISCSCVSFLNVCMLVGVCVYSYVRGKRERDMALYRLWCQCCPHFFVLSFQSIRFSFGLKIRFDWIKREIQNLFWVDFKWKRWDEDTLVEWISKWK